MLQVILLLLLHQTLLLQQQQLVEALVILADMHITTLVAVELLHL
jgi:hypothetical protein